MPPPRECRCRECSKWELGFRIISYTSWRRHNSAVAVQQRFELQHQPFQEIELNQEPIGSRSPTSISPEPLFADENFDYDFDPDSASEIEPAEWDAALSDQHSDHDGEQAERLEDPFDLDEDEGNDDANQDVEQVDGHRVVRVESLRKHHDLTPATRSAYITIAYAKMSGTPDRQADQLLEQLTATAQIAVEARGGEPEPAGPDDLVDYLGSDSRTTNNWRTAMSRLGVIGDNYIKRYICCPDCWWLTSYDRLNDLDSARCGAPLSDAQTCEGSIYSTINRVKTPIKVAPYIPLSTWLALYMQDAEFVRNLQHWRDESLGDWQPNVLDINDPVVHPDEVMRGISDGSAWRSFAGNVLRSVYGDNTVRDEQVEDNPDPLFRHTYLAYGLHIILNVDW
jgi:hypothetical protein